MTRKKLTEREKQDQQISAIAEQFPEIKGRGCFQALNSIRLNLLKLNWSPLSNSRANIIELARDSGLDNECAKNIRSTLIKYEILPIPKAKKKPVGPPNTATLRQLLRAQLPEIKGLGATAALSSIVVNLKRMDLNPAAISRQGIINAATHIGPIANALFRVLVDFDIMEKPNGFDQFDGLNVKGAQQMPEGYVATPEAKRRQLSVLRGKFPEITPREIDKLYVVLTNPSYKLDNDRDTIIGWAQAPGQWATSLRHILIRAKVIYGKAETDSISMDEMSATTLPLDTPETLRTFSIDHRSNPRLHNFYVRTAFDFLTDVDKAIKILSDRHTGNCHYHDMLGSIYANRLYQIENDAAMFEAAALVSAGIAPIGYEDKVADLQDKPLA